MSEQEDDLRATADEIAAAAERLAAIEEEKLDLESTDPEFLRLSQEAEDLAKRLVPATVAERVLATEIRDDVRRP